MRKFLRDVLLFSLPIILFNLLVYSVVNPLTNEIGYLNMVKSAPIESEVFILSDSHGTALDSQLLKLNGIVNLSYGSDSYADMYQKTKFIIQNYPVKIILVSVDRHTLSEYRDHSNNSDLSGLLNEHSQTILVRLQSIFPIFNYRYRDLFKSFLISKIEGESKKFELVENKSETNWELVTNKEETLTSRFAYQFPLNSTSEMLTRELQQMIDYAKQHDVRIIGLRFPITTEYNKMIDGFDYGAIKYFQDANLEILNYENVFQNKEYLFRDPDHVNVTGGELLTNLIIKDLENFQ